MLTHVPDQTVSIRALLLGRLISALVILFLLVDGVSRLLPWPVVTEAIDRIGYGSSDAVGRALGFVCVACSAVITIPPSSIVGAILWTGYLGNVVVSHLSIV